MSWIDRLREAAYTAPDGTRITLQYEDVGYEFDRKTTGFNFPDVDGTYVQDLGSTGRRYPLRLFFSGTNYDLEVAVFEAAITQRGIGRLEHPIYGVKDVVPFGTIARKDALKTAANQAVIEITFWETTGLIYPTSQADPAAAVLAAVEAYNAAAAAELADQLDLVTQIDRTSFENSYLALLNQASDGLQAVADKVDIVRNTFNAINNSISTGIDVLVADPVTLAFQTLALIQAPARAVGLTRDRLDAYANLTAEILAGGHEAEGANEYYSRDLYAGGYTTGAVTSTVNSQFTTKVEAIEAAEQILAQFDAVVVWRDNEAARLGEIDTGAAYQKLQEAVAINVGFLVEISFSLKQERLIVLDRDRTMIDLSAELYGAVDSELDFLISSNDFPGDYFFEIPAGTEIKYYV